MGRLLNAQLGGGYSYEDLVKESAGFLSNPKLLQGLAAAMSYFDGRARTYIEFIQLSYKEYLKQIAEKRTKADQRVELLCIRLEEQSWHALERATKDAKYVQSWEHFVAKGAAWFETYPKSEWSRQLTGRFVGAAVMSGWLAGIGRTLYQVEDYIEGALELHESYDATIKRLDVNISELMFERLSNYDDEEGRKIARFKDDSVDLGRGACLRPGNRTDN